MGVIRLIHPRHYDQQLARFRSSFFANSSDGTGISLVDTDCVRATGTPLCQHIAQYYPPRS